MADTARARLLYDALQSDEAFAARGFKAVYDPAIGVILERAGHFRGLWTTWADHYMWIAGGTSEASFATPTLSAALAFTLSEVIESGSGSVFAWATAKKAEPDSS